MPMINHVMAARRQRFQVCRRLGVGLVLLLGWVAAGVEAAPPVASGGQQPPLEVRRLQAFMDHLVSVEAGFEQRILDADAPEPKESRGRFAASRPGKFRWDYTAPYPQVIVSDGRTVWFYEPDLKQVTRSSAARLDKTPAGFLTSGKKLEEIFSWEVIPGPTAGSTAVVLKPIHEGSIRWIAITLHPKKDEILDFVVEDTLKHRSRITFTGWRANGDLSAERFRFEVPKGVDVIEHNEKNAQK
ncbi:MAG: outer membrane lipoprotein chaperone LolA [Magnetococcales bacterium]|nr:outer membrane lipoprotein chaperone LolA [Magnetococcales bacterium]NGZ05094.1 outer membrane lipoprotein chaperone LolA [Magnetococcales bacterium]